jgi:hypothetical protein
MEKKKKHTVGRAGVSPDTNESKDVIRYFYRQLIRFRSKKVQVFFTAIAYHKI